MNGTLLQKNCSVLIMTVIALAENTFTVYSGKVWYKRSVKLINCIFLLFKTNRLKRKRSEWKYNISHINAYLY